MTALPRERMSADEFLQWCQKQESGRYELLRGEIILMSPETVRHVEVKSEAWLALRNAIARSGLPCRAFADGVSIRIDRATVREPDTSIQCKEADPDSLVLDEPLVVAEVVSPSSSKTDTGAKVSDYLTVESIRQYLIIDPYAAVVIRHTRKGELILTSIHKSGAVELDPPGLTVTVEELLGHGSNDAEKQNS